MPFFIFNQSFMKQNKQQNKKPRNYLRTARRRLALSQKDVAALLGLASPAKISRHEQGRSEPNLATLLAYQLIYDSDAQELFRQHYSQLRRKMLKRAESLKKRKQPKFNKLKNESLEALIIRCSGH